MNLVDIILTETSQSQILCDFTHEVHTWNSQVQRQKVEGWLSGAGRDRMSYLMGTVLVL